MSRVDLPSLYGPLYGSLLTGLRRVSTVVDDVATDARARGRA